MAKEALNHIAQITDGNIRRNRAEKFSEYLLKTAQDEAPWTYNGYNLEIDDLEYLARNMVENASFGTCLGDLSIIRQYEKYKEKTPAIGRIMTWSKDHHLQGYIEENVSLRRRRTR